MIFVALRLLAIVPLLWLGYKKKSLTAWILISMLIGVEVGYDFPEFSQNLKIFSKIFLKLIKTIIAPLLFGTLVVGIAGHSNIKQVGRMGWKSILYFEVVTTLALFIGLAAINITQAGVGIQLPPQEGQELLPSVKQTIEDVILHSFPENIAKAVAEGAVLQIVLFSILFGIATALADEKFRKPMVHFAESLSEVMFKFTALIMYFAPIAVGAAIAYTVGHMGLGILVNLAKLLLTLYGALTFFLLFVLLPVALLFKVPIKKFIHAIVEPVSIAFATTSSEAALPKAMKAMEQIGVPRKIVAFVLPMGYSFNLDGTTLYLSLAAVFVAQAAGVELPFYTQLAMVFTLMLTSKGVAGVPRASLVILLGTLASFNLPVEPVFIILGIDELMDMARTSVNVIGNCLAAVVIAKWEGEFAIGDF
jgi:proton glutamate symport protein